MEGYGWAYGRVYGRVYDGFSELVFLVSFKQTVNMGETLNIVETKTKSPSPPPPPFSS